MQVGRAIAVSERECRVIVVMRARGLVKVKHQRLTHAHHSKAGMYQRAL